MSIVEISTSNQFYELAEKFGMKKNGYYEFEDVNSLRRAEEELKKENKEYTIFTAVWEEGGWIIQGYHFINRMSYFIIEGKYEIVADIEW